MAEECDIKRAETAEMGTEIMVRFYRAMVWEKYDRETYTQLLSRTGHALQSAIDFIYGPQDRYAQLHVKDFKQAIGSLDNLCKSLIEKSKNDQPKR